MYHKIRITVAAIVVMALCMLSSTMTLSYFTDTQSTTNEFTVGNVSTSLKVYDDVSSDNREDWRILSSANHPPITDGMEIPLYPQATNEGNIPVYQRFRIVIPTALASFIKLNLPNTTCAVETVSGNICSNDNYVVTYNSNISGHAEYRITSVNKLPVDGKTVEWPTEKIRISGISEADKSLFVCNNGDNSCTFGINVYSDAIQTTGFTSATDAFASLDNNN